MRSQVFYVCVFFSLVHGMASIKHVRHQNGVGCYKCHSFNGSDVNCGDPFHPAFNMGRYHVKCEQGMDNRIGLFPARFCTKIKGTNLKTKEELIVRSCSMQALDNSCGLFEYQNARYSGCLMSCTRDACNGSEPRRPGTLLGHATCLAILSVAVIAVLVT